MNMRRNDRAEWRKVAIHNEKVVKELKERLAKVKEQRDGWIETAHRQEEKIHRLEVENARLDERTKHLRGEAPAVQGSGGRELDGGVTVLDEDGNPIPEEDEEESIPVETLRAGKERRVYELLKDGKKRTRQEIAAELEVSPRTVTAYTGKMLKMHYWSDALEREETGREVTFQLEV